MAKVTLTQFYEELAAKARLDPGRARYAARVFKQQGILPAGKRGGGRGSPAMTSRHAALFIVGLAEPMTARRGLNLKCHDGETLLVDDIAAMVEARRRNSFKGDGFQGLRIATGVAIPNAQILLKRRNEVVTVAYYPRLEDETPIDEDSLLSSYYFLHGDILDIAAAILGPLEEAEADDEEVDVHAA